MAKKGKVRGRGAARRGAARVRWGCGAGSPIICSTRIRCRFSRLGAWADRWLPSLAHGLPSSLSLLKLSSDLGTCTLAMAAAFIPGWTQCGWIGIRIAP